MTFVFAPGVGACLADGRLMLLSIPADRYSMLQPHAEASLLRLVRGEQPVAGDATTHDRLCAMGVLRREAAPSRPRLCAATAPTTSFLDRPWRRPPVRAVIGAAGRTTRAMAALRYGGLAHTLEKLATAARPTVGGGEQTVLAASAFAELRFALRTLDRCLPLSIALARVAKRTNPDVRLVLGVACNPFGAHAWVQHGDTVLNDRLDAVATFTPILAV